MAAQLKDFERLTGVKAELCGAAQSDKPRRTYTLTTRSPDQDDTIIDRLFGTNASPSVNDAVAPLETPREYRSSNGVLDVTLTAGEERIQLGKYQININSFNKEYAGPVLRVKPGDLLRIKLDNQIDEPLGWATQSYQRGVRCDRWMD